MTEAEINNSISLRTYNARMRRGMSQAAFARLVGTSASTICSIERGMLKPGWKLREKLEKAIGKDASPEAAPAVPEKPSNAHHAPFDGQKVATPNSFAKPQPEKHLTRENLLRVAWFLEGYSARDATGSALKEKIVLLTSMADELGKEAAP